MCLSQPTAPLVTDYDKNGYTVGFPPYSGDYFLPGALALKQRLERILGRRVELKPPVFFVCVPVFEFVPWLVHPSLSQAHRWRGGAWSLHLLTALYQGTDPGRMAAHVTMLCPCS